MKFGTSMYQIINKKLSSLNHMEELVKDIIREEGLHRRSYVLGYGGLLCRSILRNIVENVIFSRGLGGHHEGMNFI